MKVLIAIPTLNEAGNVSTLVAEIRALLPHVDFVFIDDGSTDGTLAELDATAALHVPHVHQIRRGRKMGLGTAYVAAFRWALERGYDAVVEMDADHSHRPVDLVRLVDALTHHPVVVGSRYVPGGATVNWGLGRKIISRLGSFYARAILGLSVRDLTGGFNGWHAAVLRAIDCDTVRSEGYSFQIELKFRAALAGFPIEELPITFVERRAGQSKMSSRIVAEAMVRVWHLAFRRAALLKLSARSS